MIIDNTSSPLAEQHLITVAENLITELNRRGSTTRVLGGIAVAMRCPSARRPGPLARTYSDVDIVVDKRSAVVAASVLEGLGYIGEQRFNALHGHSRMMFAKVNVAHVDVFVNAFAMCHRLELADRLELNPQTLSLADLLLTKLQVAQLNAKDVTDAAAILLDHPLVTEETGLSLRRLTQVLASDWGWWRTVTENLRELPKHLTGRLDDRAMATLQARGTELLAAVDHAPKTLKWKVRARAGDRIPWREDPEETH